MGSANNADWLGKTIKFVPIALIRALLAFLPKVRAAFRA